MLESSLSGIRVLDLTRLFPGPLCTMMLVDLGAEVIKVETPEGELTRYFPPYQFGSGAMFLQLNRGKRAMTIDLRKPEGAKIVHRLLETTDVLVESFRPGVMKRFGLDYASLKEKHPQLVYCSISGYGQEGPDSQKPGHDLNYISVAGIVGLSGDDKRGYLIPPIQIADTMGGMQAATAICAALLQRFRTSRGQYLDISLLDAAFFTVIGIASIHLSGFPLNAGSLPLSGRLACYNIYRTSDNRFLALAFLEPKFWQTFCLKMQLDQYFNYQLQNDQSELIAALTRKFASKPLHEWMEFFGNDDLPITPVKSFQEVTEDPQIVLRNNLMQIEYPSGTFRQFRTPFVQDPQNKTRAPLLGEHNIEILMENGYSAEEIEKLKKDGVL